MSAPAVEAVAVGKSFGEEPVLVGIDLTVPTGSIFGLIGPSGSGKTTAVRVFTGGYRPTEGSSRVLGADSTSLPRDVRERIGYLPQLGVLSPRLSVLQNLRFHASLYGLRRQRARITELLDFVDLAGHEHKPLMATSGGMQRRAGLAAALLHEPELVFLDEPTSGVDPVLRQRFWQRFHELRDSGVTLVITTQIVSETALCDVVGLLVAGRLVGLDTPEGLRRQAMGGDALDVRFTSPVDAGVLALLRDKPGVVRVARLGVEGDRVRIIAEDGDAVTDRLAAWFADRGEAVELVERYQAPFDDVFVALVEAQAMAT